MYVLHMRVSKISIQQLLWSYALRIPNSLCNSWYHSYNVRNQVVPGVAKSEFFSFLEMIILCNLVLQPAETVTSGPHACQTLIIC